VKGADNTTADGLHRVQLWSDANGAAYLKPGADLGRYKQVILDEVTVAYKRPPHRAHETDSSLRQGNYALPPDTMKKLKRYFHESFAKQLDKGTVFAVTDQPAPDALRVSGHIVNLVVTAKPWQDQEGDERDYGKSPGSFTLILDVRDSESNDPLVRLAHASLLDYNANVGLRESNPVQNSAAVRQQFDQEAALLRNLLEKLGELPEIPEVPSSDTKAAN